MTRREDAAPRTESPALRRRCGGIPATVLLALALTTGAPAGSETGSRGDYPIQPVPFTAVTVADEFWSPRLETNRTVTVRYDFQKCERTGRVANFARAGGLEEGDFEGLYGFNDSDVFKVIEGASYALSLQHDAELEQYLDELALKITAAQEEDGYLYTVGTIGSSAKVTGNLCPGLAANPRAASKAYVSKGLPGASMMKSSSMASLRRPPNPENRYF